MSHVWCIACRGNDHICGFGLAAGGYGAYTICECGELLEHTPLNDDEEHMPPEFCTPHGLEFVGGQDDEDAALKAPND